MTITTRSNWASDCAPPRAMVSSSCCRLGGGGLEDLGGSGFRELVAGRADGLLRGLLVVVFFVAMVAGLPRFPGTMPSLRRAAIQPFPGPRPNSAVPPK
jgi:hypothetical protein